MFDFFFDTADISYIRDLWKKLDSIIDPTHIRGVTTNPNAFNKIDMNSIGEWRVQLHKLCEVISEIRGDDKGVVYVQAPNSEMSPVDVLRWAQFICPVTDGSTSIGIKIPPFYPILEIVDELNSFTEVNVTGVSDCSTALSCFTYDVRYVSLIPGRMEERGINSIEHLGFAQRRKNSSAEIISGSMRTIEGLESVCDVGTVPTIGSRVWDEILQKGPELLLKFSEKPFIHKKFSPLIGADNIQLSVDFFEQMDECGNSVYNESASKYCTTSVSKIHPSVKTEGKNV